jgi:acyl carrier protein
MSNYREYLPDLYEVLQPFSNEGEQLTEDTQLVADLGLDSLKIMELMLEIEDRFDISIPLNVLPDIRTIKDLAKQVGSLSDTA